MGLFGQIKESVTLVNRTRKTLSVRYDGEFLSIPPLGRIENFPKVAVPFAILQNKLMGSEHPYDPGLYTCMIGFEGSAAYPPDPLPDEMIAEADTCMQPVDRKGTIHGVEMEPVRPGRKAGFTTFEARASVGTFDTAKGVGDDI